ncbi:Phosphate-responsive 1 family protein [Candidatus Sulfopaludibacter sp. SbA4]|nr:Phosphate-responsive 1 family protein [Candidatus Sulfopaludibacter sp. SbA4]
MKFCSSRIAATLLAATGLAVVALAQGDRPRTDPGDDGINFAEKIKHKPNPHGAPAAPPAGSIGIINPPITYHGGPVIGTPNVYLIWYGNWNQNNGTDTAAGQQIIRDFVYGINNSAYFKINTTYTTGPYTVTGSVNKESEFTVGSPYSNRLSDNGVLTVVSNAINVGNKNGKLPYDANGVYFVLTSSDVNETSGFCTQYCGWHYWGNTSSHQHVRYSFIGNAARCLNACAIQSTGPNGNAGVDGMASILAHELSETTTDPDGTGWWDSQGQENGDKCAWTFGQTLTTLASGAYYNVTLPASSTSSRNFEIQRMLKQAPNADTCNMSLTSQ